MPITSTPLYYRLDPVTRRIHYIEHGPELPQSGTPRDLLILHGNGANALLYEPMIRHLGKHFRVIAPDLPGYGRSPAKHHQIEPYVKEMETFIQNTVSPGAICIGHSLGGLLTYLLYQQKNLRFDKMVLMEPALFPKIPRWASLMLPGYSAYVQYSPHSRERTRNAVRVIALNYDDSTSFIRERFIESYIQADRAIQAMFFRSYPRYLPLDFSHYHMPVLCIRGEKDSYISVVTDQVTPLIPNARKHVIPNAGHFLIGENEAGLFAAIDTFLLPETV